MDQNLRTSEPRWTFTGSYKKEKVQSSLLASLLAAAIPPPTVFMAESINWISFHNKWLLPFYHLFVRSFYVFCSLESPMKVVGGAGRTVQNRSILLLIRKFLQNGRRLGKLFDINLCFPE